MADLTALVDRFRDLEVVVLGDAVLDAWLDGETQRLCREGPVPVVDVSGSQLVPGGAANAAANLAALGARPRLVAAVGDDRAGSMLRDLLRDAGVDTSALVEVPGRITPTKRRLTTAGQLVARFVETPSEPLGRRTAAAVAGALADRLPGPGGLLLVSDYGLGCAAAPVRSAVRQLRADLDVLVVDARDLRAWADTRPTAATPNAEEVSRLVGAGSPAPPGERADQVAVHAEALLDQSGAELVAATVDIEGVMLLRPGQPAHRVRVRPAAEAGSTGAGDSFAAVLLLALAAGAAPVDAVELAAAAAECTVHTAGTVVCDRAALLRRLRRAPDGGSSGRVLTTDELVRMVDRYRLAGLRVVFTNGCFDVLHAGHVGYLEEASRLGDVLVVGLNSDASVARLKGPDRPVHPQEDRAALLAALAAVDHVTVFDEDSPVRLLELVRPEVYVKGGDYTAEMLPETPVVRRLGGEVRTVGYRQHRSSSGIIDRIRAGATPAGQR